MCSSIQSGLRQVDKILNNNHGKKLFSGNRLLSFQDKLPSVLGLAVIFFLNFSARFIWGPLLVDIEKDLSISHTVSGSLFFYITIGYFFGVLFSSHLSYKLNHRKTISFSCISCGLALFAASYAPFLLYLKVLLVVVGAAAGFHLPSAIASVIDNLEPREFGKAFSVHEMGPIAGFIICPLLSELMLKWGSWRQALLPIVIGLIAMGAFHGFKSITGEARGEPPSFGNIAFVLSKSAFWVMLIHFMLGLGAAVGVYAMLPLYLQIERGMGQTFSNIILSVSRFVAIPAPFVAGWMSCRYGNRSVTAIIVLLNGLSTVMLGIFPNRWICFPLLVQPFLAAGFFVPAYAILAGMVPSGFRNLIIVLIMPMAMILGGGALPTMLGAFGDAHSFWIGFILIGCLLTGSTVLLFMVQVSETNDFYG